MERLRTHDFEALSRQHAGRWVAIDPATEAVVSSGETAKEVFDLALRKGVPSPLVIKIQEEYRSFVA